MTRPAHRPPRPETRLPASLADDGWWLADRQHGALTAPYRSLSACPRLAWVNPAPHTPIAESRRGAAAAEGRP